MGETFKIPSTVAALSLKQVNQVHTFAQMYQNHSHGDMDWDNLTEDLRGWLLRTLGNLDVENKLPWDSVEEASSEFEDWRFGFDDEPSMENKERKWKELLKQHVLGIWPCIGDYQA